MKRSNSERNFPVVFRLEGSSFIFCAKRLQSDFHFCKIKINHFDCGNRFNIQAKAPSCQENPYAFHPTKKGIRSAFAQQSEQKLNLCQRRSSAGASFQRSATRCGWNFSTDCAQMAHRPRNSSILENESACCMP